MPKNAAQNLKFAQNVLPTKKEIMIRESSVTYKKFFDVYCRREKGASISILCRKANWIPEIIVFIAVGTRD